MKYMGSKRKLLTKELGVVLEHCVKRGDSFVDLFSGSGAVSWYAATKLQARVTAVDLQEYSRIMNAAVIERTGPIQIEKEIPAWLYNAKQKVDETCDDRIDSVESADSVLKMRGKAAQSELPFVRDYAGFYLSFRQAEAINILRNTIPGDKATQVSCLAALIMSVSDCCASPGHTAQPLRPNDAALPFIRSAWSRDPFELVWRNVCSLQEKFATYKGNAVTDDANSYAEHLNGNEIVFLDPPYSSVQYSRFYHVLEAVALGGYSEVFGAGRMPDAIFRQKSLYSLKSTAHSVLLQLLETLAHNSSCVILTFPYGTASNGINGEELQEEVRKWYRVRLIQSDSVFSSLGGGSKGNRAARAKQSEMLLIMEPR